MSDLWAHLEQIGWSCTRTLTDRLGSDDIARYAGASGDVNLVHVDEAFARRAGHPGLLAHGMLTMGLTGSCVAGLVGHHRLRRFGGRFLAPVLSGDQLSCTTELRSVKRVAEGTFAALAVTTSNGTGATVFRGTALALRSREES